MTRLLDWLGAGFAGIQTVEQKNHSSGFLAFHAGTNASWSWGTDSAIDNGYCRNPIVYRCVRMISQAGASVPFKVCEQRVDCSEHPFLDLLARPNEYHSGTELMERIYSHLLISGNSYVMRVGVANRIRELHTLDPTKLTIRRDTNGWPESYQYQNDRDARSFSSGQNSDLLHLCMFNPRDEFEGMAPLNAAQRSLDIHNAASEWNKALLDNSARPSGALVYAAPDGANLSDEQFQRLKTELEQGYAGANRAGRPMVLEGGLDWKAMAYSPKDMDFLEAKNGAAREIALTFGVPPMLLGIPGDNTYSNYVEANRAFWTQTVLPLVNKVADGVSKWLAPVFGDGVALLADREQVEVLSVDQEKRWNRIREATFLTTDEKRQMLGFSPLPEGEAIE